jgi:hypothetical protein
MDPGLRHILLHHGCCRKDVYKRLFQILWFGNSLGKGADGRTPTYVFPTEIRNAVRKRFPDVEAGKKDEEYRDKEGVFHVTVEEIMQIKWPAAPKSCTVCKLGRGKPY